MTDYTTTEQEQAAIDQIKAAVTKAICGVDGCKKSDFVYALLEMGADIVNDHSVFGDACNEVAWSYLLPKLAAAHKERAKL
jgi:hypothetical protein